jgi:parallel beta-helix repeat protein
VREGVGDDADGDGNTIENNQCALHEFVTSSKAYGIFIEDGSGNLIVGNRTFNNETNGIEAAELGNYTSGNLTNDGLLGVIRGTAPTPNGTY